MRGLALMSVLATAALGGMPLNAEELVKPDFPIYTSNHEMHETTWLVKDKSPAARIVAPDLQEYKALATALVECIKRKSGVEIPVESDSSPDALIPFKENLILIGNRSSNKVMGRLYDMHYLLTDLYYPGAGGYELRSLHSPFGNGFNAIIVGGSDLKGCEAAATRLTRMLEGSQAGADLAVGWTLDVNVADALKIPASAKEAKGWSSGYFPWGWNSVSKNMALYYMTGEAKFAREFLRLALPDEAAQKEIFETDGELIEDKTDPLASPYHYAAHNMILFWDLIEESPVFSAEAKLKVLNAFSRQLRIRGTENGNVVLNCRKPPVLLGDRHLMYNFLSTYVLARYFKTQFHDQIWEKAYDSVVRYMSGLDAPGVSFEGEYDSHAVFSTCLYPIIRYLLLALDTAPVRNGNLGRLLRKHELLIKGGKTDWGIKLESPSYFREAASLTGNGAFLEYLARKQDTPYAQELYLGQSFMPPPELKPVQPDYLVGHWEIDFMDKPTWATRHSGLPLENSFCWGSFRTHANQEGDYLMLDGFMGGGRNSYHAFTTVELRLDGYPVLYGHQNRPLVYADGIMGPKISRDASILSFSSPGTFAFAQAEVADLSFAKWRRTLCHRDGSYSLFVDSFTPSVSSDDFEVVMVWQGHGEAWESGADKSVVRIEKVSKVDSDATTTFNILCSAQPASVQFRKLTEAGGWLRGAAGQAELRLAGKSLAGQPRHVFSIVAPEGGGMRCAAIADNAAVISSSPPAIAFTGKYDGSDADAAIIAADYIAGCGVTRIVVDGQELYTSSQPASIHWDLASGELSTAVDTFSQRSERVRRPLNAEQQLALSGYLAAKLKLMPAPLAASAVKTTVTEAKLVLDAPIKQVFVDAASGMMAIASGTSLSVFDLSLRKLFQTELPAEAQTLHWWRQHAILLAGCKNGYLGAFDKDGKLLWFFNSQMAPEILRMGKQYWFSTAPGNEGIHGLADGVFPEQDGSLFVGSACNLELLDKDGVLKKRRSVFFGLGKRFCVVPASNGTRNLLIARSPADGPGISVVNSAHIDPPVDNSIPRPDYGIPAERLYYNYPIFPTTASFNSIPPGNTNMAGGFTQQRADFLLSGDFDGGNDVKVLVGVNGSWCRVTLYDTQAMPLANMNLGPYQPGGICAMTATDLNNDGKQEILVGLISGKLLARDARLGALWTADTGAKITALGYSQSQQAVLAGTEDGMLHVFSAKGSPRGVYAAGGKVREFLDDGKRVLVFCEKGIYELPFGKGEGKHESQ